MKGRDLPHLGAAADQPADAGGAIEELARAVHGRGLHGPALFVLEAHRPLAGLAHAALLVSQPLMMVFFGTRLARQALGLLQSDGMVERLIKRIEELRDTAGES